MELLIAAALAVCVETPENCTTEQLAGGTYIHVCDIAPEVQAEDIHFATELPNGMYYFTLSPKCKEY